MAASLTVKDAMLLLESSKVTDRQRALVALRAIFENDVAVDSLDPSRTGKPWLALYQSVFSAALTEYNACTRKDIAKAAPTSLARLADVASFLKWLTTRAVRKLNKRTLTPLLNHLLQLIIHRDSLLTPVAEHYAKTICIILAHQPHMDHIDSSLWTKILALSFASILGDRLDKALILEDGHIDDPSQLTQDEVASEVELPESGSSLRKRRAVASMSSNRPTISIPPSSPLDALSDVQIQFMTIIRILLRSTHTPYLAHEDYEMARVILTKFCRFFHTYKTNTSSHPDAVWALEGILSQLEFNAKSLLFSVSNKLMTPLMTVWSSANRNKSLKEGLLIVFRTLFHFWIHCKDDGLEEGLDRMNRLLESEAGTRFSSFLQLENIRLCHQQGGSHREPFQAKSFRASLNFDPDLAFIWSVLELHADLLNELHQRLGSKVISPSQPSPAKRPRLQRVPPAASLLQQIATSHSTEGRVYRLQILLFLIDRHWSDMESDMQALVLSSLSSFPGLEESTYHSWSLICLAAIAENQDVSPPFSNWSQLWSLATRMMQTPATCRAAFHLAHLLMVRRRIIPSQISADFEKIANDVIVQGPRIPFDSVCLFFEQLLLISNQDMALHALGLHDTLLNWVAERILAFDTLISSPLGINPFTTSDVLRLLESSCGLARRLDLVCVSTLPDCSLVEWMFNRSRQQTIRSYMLEASLPSDPSPAVPTVSTIKAHAVSGSNDPVREARSGEQGQPRARDRKITSALLNVLEQKCQQWEAETDLVVSLPTVRNSMDLSVLALSFVTSLNINGTRFNIRIIKLACKLIRLALSRSKLRLWSPHEWAMILLSMDPLVNSGEQWFTGDSREAMVNPGPRTGIAKGAHFNSPQFKKAGQLEEVLRRKEAQTLLWSQAELDEDIPEIVATLRQLMETEIGDPLFHNAVDQNDNLAEADSSKEGLQSKYPQAINTCIRVCMGYVIITAVRRQGMPADAAEPVRDRQLINHLLEPGHESRFFLTARSLFQLIRNKELQLSSDELSRIAQYLEQDILKLYSHNGSPEVQSLLLQFLSSTCHSWTELAPDDPDDPLGGYMQSFLGWISGLIIRAKVLCWRVREEFIQLIDLYVGLDPECKLWPTTVNSLSGDDISLTSLLGFMAKDVDTRVRFRVAIVNARVVQTVAPYVENIHDLYKAAYNNLCADVSRHEHMLTRFLSLGNFMIVDASIRRGPYWHLLETSFHSEEYLPYLLVILHEVSGRIGLSGLSELFEAYAAPIAYSTSLQGLEFTHIHSSLLGYQGRSEAAAQCFPQIAPIYALSCDSGDTTFLLQQPFFASYLRASSQSSSQAVSMVLPTIIGWRLAFNIDQGVHGFMSDSQDRAGQQEFLVEDIKAWTSLTPIPDVVDSIQELYDRVVFSILRILSDIDDSPDGTISASLGGGERSSTFVSMTGLRTSTDPKMHTPSLPSLKASAIVPALGWLERLMDTRDINRSGMVYHVVRQLFAAIERTPLVNEQLRLVNALCLHLSYYCAKNIDQVTLRTVMQGATALLQKQHLVHPAQSILEWALQTMKDVGRPTQNLMEILTRIAEAAVRYSTNNEPVGRRQLGEELFDWIEQHCTVLAEERNFRELVFKALSLWPREISEGHTGRLTYSPGDRRALRNLSSIIRDPSSKSNKFQVARRLAAIASKYPQVLNTFSADEFWQLKACIPSPDRLSDEDVQAFTTLLFLNNGHIVTVPDRPESFLGLALRQKFPPGPQGNPPQAPSAQQYIVLALHSMLASESLAIVDMAYLTLRGIFSASFTPSEMESASEEVRQESILLASYPVPLMIRRTRNLDELDTREYTDISADFALWVSSVALFFVDILAEKEKIFSQLVLALTSNVDLATELLPILTRCVLTTPLTVQSSRSAKDIVSKYYTGLLRNKDTCVECRQSIVQVILHLRHFNPPYESSDQLAYNLWLNIDFLLLGEAAMMCGAYTTALLFLELSFDHPATSSNLSDPSIMEDILFEIYSHIEEPDGFYGIQTRDVAKFLNHRFRHESQWENSFLYSGASFEAGLKSGSLGVAESLHSYGFHQLAMQTVLSTANKQQGGDGSLSDVPYELAWRTQRWDLPLGDIREYPGATLYAALRAVHRVRDQITVDGVVRHLLREEMERLRALGNEDMAQIRKSTQTLMCLREIQRRDHLKSSGSSLVNNAVGNEWSTISGDFEFHDLECILAVRRSVIQSTRAMENLDQVGDVETSFAQDMRTLEHACNIRLAEAARDAGRLPIAISAVQQSKALEIHGLQTFSRTREFAAILWMQDEQKIAVEYLRELISGLPEELKLEKPFLLSQLGEWVAAAGLENALDIRKQYFDPASLQLESELSRDSTSASTAAHVFHRYAIFSEEQHQSVIRSPEVLRLKLYVERMKNEINEIDEQIKQMETKAQGSRSGADHNKLQILRRQREKSAKLLNEDETSYNMHIEARDAFLQQAILMLAKCLAISEDYNHDTVIRLCSLWFSNFTDDSLNVGIRSSIMTIPSHKFLILSYQLSSRLSMVEAHEGQKTLNNLMRNLGRLHPYHTLYQVFALIESDPTAHAGATSTRRSSINQISNVNSSQKDRAEAGSNLLGILQRDSASAHQIRDVELVCRAYLEWAKHPIEKNTKGGKIQSQLRILKLKDIKVPVPTDGLQPIPTGDYSGAPYIRHYEPDFTTAGGVNLPKISVCVGSDGIRRRQLFKGQGDDDLRQDAVMEQVFDIVNFVLTRDRQTRRRRLCIRTYKVIPLAPQAGVIEFVRNTVPLSNWLLSAHPRYRPQDMRDQVISKKMVDVRESIRRGACRPDKLVTEFKKCREQFKPVMRHFFTEKCRHPTMWFDMRLNYSRSVATTSIVGHIIGLGDRHVSNILMHQYTGEVVHIDLGIAFDQGKLLKIPETVPFRLTADMVDGLGSTGTEGVFRRCAEETLRVLRDQSKIVMTVLEVFKTDPLHSWTAHPIKVRRIQETHASDRGAAHQQNVGTTSTIDTYALGIQGDMLLGIGGLRMESDTVEEQADRALSSVAKKLEKKMSVSHVVNELIMTATDVGNLAKLFQGWRPWL
ncbi:Serine/threonine-protein kinase tel1 [Tulasnella sp. 419]|nr:Serine/threonine-protein kinase tel1 [Tulasnella sp. 419]